MAPHPARAGIVVANARTAAANEPEKAATPERNRAMIANIVISFYLVLTLVAIIGLATAVEDPIE